MGSVNIKLINISLNVLMQSLRCATPPAYSAFAPHQPVREDGQRNYGERHQTFVPQARW
ncbi:hypothetical protein BN1221_02146 [Brenneria goodwinii]|uniref:Uncharacterized protein n=1 Tax=Brenneria goodwinii TaxID=1109412 RepID=A0A0G4JUZ0_9GAMM|nr:hypothetical protein BN1221_02146 [Brenneria goodwinii]